MAIKKFLFDLGNVFFDWNPKHVLKNYIPDENKLDNFLKNIAFPHLDMRCDAGIKIDVAVSEAIEKFPEHEKGIIEAAKECGMGRVKAGFHYLADYVAGNLLAEKMFLVMNKDDYGKYLDEAPRIPRKKGQPAGSDKHSDLYTDENPKGTIHGLKFATVKDAQQSVKKIEGSGKKHAHKVQAAIAMEQRAKEMGKTAEAGVYRAYIEKMKKITQQRREK